jgi:Zn finger protein HypA/HybF involved in hydrogenase expression
MIPEVKDKVGNNAIVVCTNCKTHFLVSGFHHHKNGRVCPHCGKTRASISMRGQDLKIEPVE